MCRTSIFCEPIYVETGVEECPEAKEGVPILILEPSGTLNTGDAATAAARQVI
jgi:hypothetical protein